MITVFFLPLIPSSLVRFSFFAGCFIINLLALEGIVRSSGGLSTMEGYPFALYSSGRTQLIVSNYISITSITIIRPHVCMLCVPHVCMLRFPHVSTHMCVLPVENDTDQRRQTVWERG